MKFLDYVKQSIYQYPLLYLSDSFDTSKFRVLCDTFLTATKGNGVDWAKNRNPKKGGYVIEPKYYERHGDWVRKFDKNYGVESFDVNIELYFKENVYELCEINREETDDFFKESKYKDFIELHVNRLDRETKISFVESDMEKIKSKYGDFIIFDSYIIDIKDYTPETRWFVKKVNIQIDEKHPPSYCNKKFSLFWQNEAKYAQEDWKIAGIDFFSYLIHYFNTPELYKNYFDRYKLKFLQFQKQIIDNYSVNGIIDIERVRKNYEFPLFDGTNFKELQEFYWNKICKNNIEYYEETIFRILNF